MPRYIATDVSRNQDVLAYDAESDGAAVAALPAKLLRSGIAVDVADVGLSVAYDGVHMPIRMPIATTVPVFNLLDTKLERDEDGDGTFHVWCSGEGGDDFELAMDMTTASVEVVAWSTPDMVAMDPKELSSETVQALRWWATRDYGVQAQYEDARTEERRARAEE